MSKTLLDNLNAKLEKEIYAGVIKDAPKLDLKAMFEIKNKLDRYSHVYVLAAEHLPDDCYGILYVRPEDMP